MNSLPRVNLLHCEISIGFLFDIPGDAEILFALVPLRCRERYPNWNDPSDRALATVIGVVDIDLLIFHISYLPLQTAITLGKKPDARYGPPVRNLTLPRM